MTYYKFFKGFVSKPVGKKKIYEDNVFVLDIETTSCIKVNNKILTSEEYEYLNEKDKKTCQKISFMYIWMISVNDKVYYGRTYEEMKEFLYMINIYSPYKKIFFVHNLAYEFQFLKSQFEFTKVFARSPHKPIKCELEEYNIEFRCSYFMSNVALDYLAEMYDLPIKKLKGNLDYNKIRTEKTELSKKELEYCENDCLVVYYYILEEKKTYKEIKKIPKTSTGHVRQEFKEKIEKDYKYLGKVRKSINKDTHVYNMLVKAFTGGYTHSNWIYTGEVLENITSFDFTSSYPYVMVSHKYPMSEFRKTNISKIESIIRLSNTFAYLIHIKFKNITCNYFNNFISLSKCINVKKGRYDNGRVIKAEELEIIITDVDLGFLIKAYNFEDYEIVECYQSRYDYLPLEYINFILDKYVIKTEYKGITEKQIEYMKEKNKFNSLYGMSVTNTIRDDVEYNKENDWFIHKLTNEEIESRLEEEKKRGFLSFAFGVWVTAIARRNLIENVIKLDKYVVYCDTDSMKLLEGFDKNVILEYNKFVENKIKFVSEKLKIDIKRYKPKDKKGKEHLLGIFEEDEFYNRFITQGSKKYAYEFFHKYKGKKIKKDKKYFLGSKIKRKLKNRVYHDIHITVAGIPKKRSKSS